MSMHIVYLCALLLPFAVYLSCKPLKYSGSKETENGQLLMLHFMPKLFMVWNTRTVNAQIPRFQETRLL